MDDQREATSRHGRRRQRILRRRTFLELLLGGGLVSAAGVAARARTVGFLPVDATPYQLWTQPSTEVGFRDLVTAAVLAANPHNSQPWKFRVDEDHIDVFLDRSRALGPVDPFLRQMHLGVGCAIENLCVAARARRLTAEAILFPDPARSDLAARVSLQASEDADADMRHAAVIRYRHTNRGPYDRSRQLSSANCDALEAQSTTTAARVHLFAADSDMGRSFSQSTVAATEALVADAEFMQATDRWFRGTPHEVAEHADGPSLHCAGLSPLVELGAMLLPRRSGASFHASWLEMTRDVHLATAPTFGLVTVGDATRESLIEAGRLWQRVHLEATVLGLGIQPLDQAIEASERARQLGTTSTALAGAAIAPGGSLLAMMFRVGHPLRVAVASARRPLTSVLM